MENREKLEIPTISFTAVTLLDAGGNSSCNCQKCTTVTSGWTQGAVGDGGEGGGVEIGEEN